MKLPIELIPGTAPPQFRWQQVVTTLAGERVVSANEGSLPPSVEPAVVELIVLCRRLEEERNNADTLVSNQRQMLDQQAQEVARLQKQIEGHVARIAAQSELLSKRAEAPQKQIQPQQAEPRLQHSHQHPTNKQRDGRKGG